MRGILFLFFAATVFVISLAAFVTKLQVDENARKAEKAALWNHHHAMMATLPSSVLQVTIRPSN